MPRIARTAALIALSATALTGCGAPATLDVSQVGDCADQVNKEVPCYHEAGESGRSFYHPECLNACVNQKTVYAGQTVRPGWGLTEYVVPEHR